MIPGVLLPLSGLFPVGQSMVWAHSSPRWPKVIGKITSSRIRKRVTMTDSSDESPWYIEPVVTYKYTLDGVVYHGKRLSFNPAPDEPTLVKAIVREYPVGKEVRVYYHPQKREVAILRPGGAAQALMGLICLLVLAVGFAAGMVFLYRLDLKDAGKQMENEVNFSISF